MRKLIAFNHVTLDGYFVGRNGDFRWAHAGNDDPEYSKFVAENASGGGQLLFGRVTYELMASYWPTPVAEQHDPAVAKGMNSMSKVVFSRTLTKASWNNTKLIKGDLVSEIRKMKSESGPGMAILGSGSIIAQLGSGACDRRVPDDGGPHRAGEGPEHVRRHPGAAEPEAHQDTHLRQW